MNVFSNKQPLIPEHMRKRLTRALAIMSARFFLIKYMFVNSLIKDLVMPARSVAHISVTNHAAHLIHLPYQIMIAMIDVHGKEWVCKAVRQPFFPYKIWI